LKVPPSAAAMSIHSPAIVSTSASNAQTNGCIVTSWAWLLLGHFIVFS
jgi:hypothetical protein